MAWYYDPPHTHTHTHSNMELHNLNIHSNPPIDYQYVTMSQNNTPQIAGPMIGIGPNWDTPLGVPNNEREASIKRKNVDQELPKLPPFNQVESTYETLDEHLKEPPDVLELYDN